VFDDGSGPALYAGGAFDTAGNVQANGIAKWDGSSWSALGSGLGFGQNSILHFDIIRSLIAYNDGTGPALFAGGHFSLAGNNIMKWNGTTWSNMNCGVYGGFGSLQVFDDGTGPALYAGTEGFIVPPPGGCGLSLGGSLGNVAKWTCASSLGGLGNPGLALSQTEDIGTGANVFVTNSNMIPGQEYYNIFSLDLCPGGVGTGPYAGLCFNPGNTQFLLNQLLLPLGTMPLHFIAPTSGITNGPYALPPITLEGVCFEVNAGGIGATSAAIRFTIQ